MLIELEPPHHEPTELFYVNMINTRKGKKKAALLLMTFETLILRFDMFAMYPSFEMKNGVLSAQKS